MKRQQGFNLIELMVTVAVLFTLGAFAIPAYRDYVETADRAVMIERINGLRPFIENARIDTGAYPGGTYVPGGANSFSGLGYTVPGDRNGITLRVTAGACGSLNDCYRVTAVNPEGVTAVWEAGEFTWP